MDKRVNVREAAVIWSPRCSNHLRWETAREIWMSLSPGRTIWELASDDEVSSLMKDIRDAFIE